jgi:hypothetical protein
VYDLYSSHSPSVIEWIVLKKVHACICTYIHIYLLQLRLYIRKLEMNVRNAWKAIKSRSSPISYKQLSRTIPNIGFPVFRDIIDNILSIICKKSQCEKSAPIKCLSFILKPMNYHQRWWSIFISVPHTCRTLKRMPYSPSLFVSRFIRIFSRLGRARQLSFCTCQFFCLHIYVVYVEDGRNVTTAIPCGIAVEIFLPQYRAVLQ